MSIRKEYEQELAELKLNLVKMCRLTERMLEDSIDALMRNDTILAKAISISDDSVDEFETKIEKSCMRILLRQQPVAKDFRDVSTALKVITDLERIGDQACDIAEIVLSLNASHITNEVSHIKTMGEITVTMVRNSVESFIKSDYDLADAVISMDDTVDSLFITVKQEIIELIKINSDNADRAILLLMIAKYFERIGDHAVNVAGWAIFNDTGIHKP